MPRKVKRLKFFGKGSIFKDVHEFLRAEKKKQQAIWKSFRKEK
ncbi:MAG: hypothetical protein ACP5M7_09445 [Thermoproteota archaeon]|jgi:hypothetical protein